LGALIGAPAARVARIPQARVGTGLVAAGLGPGDEVVVPDDEFTSTLFPLLVAERRGAVISHFLFPALHATAIGEGGVGSLGLGGGGRIGGEVTGGKALGLRLADGEIGGENFGRRGGRRGRSRQSCARREKRCELGFERGIGEERIGFAGAEEVGGVTRAPARAGLAAGGESGLRGSFRQSFG